MTTIKNKLQFSKTVFQLGFIILAAAIVRIYFFNGIVFSDDTYYDFLGLSLAKGHYAQGYIGYPVFLLRKLHSFLTASSFVILGVNIIGSIFFPFLISIAGIILAYFFALEITENKKAAILSSLLLVFFPPDIIFSTINFTDLQTAFFMNLGLLFLFRAVKKESYRMSILSGLTLFLSLLLKEIIFFVIILLAVLFFYLLLKNRPANKFIFVSLLTFTILLFFEALCYSIFQNDFFFRIHTLTANYKFCAYDFFPNTTVANPNNRWELFGGLLKQIFLLNPKYFFLRRFYLFIPLIALLHSFYLIKKKQFSLLVFWFVGVAVLMIGFTTSFTDYKPLDLKRNYYIFTAILPAIILTAIFLSRVNYKYLSVILLFYLMMSFVMSDKYQDFFDVKNNKRLIEFVNKNKTATFYTDHHTAYGLYVLTNYKSDRINIFTSNSTVQPINHSFLIYNRAEIKELKKQKFSFPDIEKIIEKNFFLEATYGKFEIYRRKELPASGY